MAIPFYIPSDEETANNYRSLDDLLWQLCDVLRQILLHRPVPQDLPTQADEARPARDAVPDLLDEVPRAPLPDLLGDIPRASLPDLVSGAGPRRPPRRHEAPAPPRRHRRRPRKSDASSDESTSPCDAPERKVTTRDNWTQVGEDLRKIADDFHVSLQDLERSPPSAASSKRVSLVSLLMPRGPLWMAVIVLLGWGAIQRTR